MTIDNLLLSRQLCEEMRRQDWDLVAGSARDVPHVAVSAAGANPFLDRAVVLLRRAFGQIELHPLRPSKPYDRYWSRIGVQRFSHLHDCTVSWIMEVMR